MTAGSPYLDLPRRPRQLTDYTVSRTADGLTYRRNGTALRFTVDPFCGMWRATNGTRNAFGRSPDEAAINFVRELGR